MTETTTTSRRRPPAVTGALSMTLDDGSTLTARTDVRLAEQWAEHQHGPVARAALTFGQRTRGSIRSPLHPPRRSRRGLTRDGGSRP